MAQPKITRRKLEDYKPSPLNPNQHTERGLQVIEDSIHYNGAGRSGLVAKDGTFIAGHGTWEAMARAGIEEVIEVEADGHQWVIVRRNDLDPDDPRSKALMIADNRASELDYAPDDELLGAILADLAADDDKWVRAAGWNEGELQALLDGLPGAPQPDPGPQIDRADELQQVWQVARGDLWEIGDHRLLCGDSTNAEDVARLGDIDVLFTDPPYGIAVDTSWLSTLNVKRGKPANMSDDRLQGDDGSLDLSFLFNYPRRMIWGFPYIFDTQATGWIVWDKQPGVDQRGIVTPIEMASTTMRKGFDMVRCMWGGYYRATGETREPHPTQKPVQVMTPFIEDWTENSDIVFDPFLGSGTTLVACEQTGRRGRGIEIAEKYCAVTLQRLADMGLEPRRVNSTDTTRKNA